MPSDNPIRKLTEEEKDRVAVRLLDDLLGGALLPPYVAGEPASLAAAHAAPRTARELMIDLAQLYGLADWDERSYREIFLGRAFAAWKGDLSVGEDAGSLRIAAPGCPIRGVSERDPRVCRMCQAVQEHLARAAFPAATFRMVSTAFSADQCVAVVGTAEP